METLHQIDFNFTTAEESIARYEIIPEVVGDLTVWSLSEKDLFWAIDIKTPNIQYSIEDLITYFKNTLNLDVLPDSVHYDEYNRNFIIISSQGNYIYPDMKSY